MLLDMPTVLVLQALASMVSGAILSIVRTEGPWPGLREIKAATWLLVPAFALIALRGRIPGALTVALPTALLWSSHGLLVVAYRRLDAPEHPVRGPLLAGLAAAAGFTALWAFGASYRLRALVASLVSAAMCGAALWALVRDGGLAREPSRRVSAWLMSAVALCLAARAALLAAGVTRGESILTPSLERSLGFVPGVILWQGVVMAFVLLHRERSEAAARHLATIDALTGCLTRRALESRVRAEIAHAQRHRRPCALLVIDLDHFKRVNDAHGHAGGDAVLAHAAAVLRAGVRTGDLVGRYGGEEFCVLLRETQAEGALVVAERFRAALAASPVSLPRGAVRVGASLGLAAFDPGSGEGFEALFRRADDALYRAKGAGRGRCEVAPATVDELAPRLSASPSPPG